ncbi:MFS transporter [Actinomadura verrucosospora]|uniref:MFS transporter n=1 Tax=Actinomadura verrucosospora TaxID=46165 RepID=UPI001FE68C37|nr:MFS transporter [Actinomadura verrucosospora]
MTITDTSPASAVRGPAAASAPAEQAWTPRLWGVLAVLCAVLFLDGLDVSMVGVALPSIGTELGLSTTSLQWIVNGYVLGYGSLLLLGGRTADLLGRRRVFLTALAVFAVASLVGGLVSDGTLLIVTRFVKGLAAAFTAPTALSILTTTFHEGRARNRALSVFSVFGASGYSSGLILGGLLTSFGWRWTFLTPVPLALIALVAGIALIPRDKAAADGGHDIVGAVTLTGGMLLAVYTVVSAPDRGWLDPVTLGSVALAAALLIGFVVTEKKVRHPLIRLGILRIGRIVRANLSIVALFGSYLSFQFMMTLYLQDVLHWSPLKMAMALLPAGLIVAFGSPFVGRLIDRFGTPRLIISSMTSLSLGYVWFLATAGDTRTTPSPSCRRCSCWAAASRSGSARSWPRRPTASTTPSRAWPPAWSRRPARSAQPWSSPWSPPSSRAAPAAGAATSPSSTRASTWSAASRWSGWC